MSNELRTYIKDNAVTSWDRATRLQQDQMVSIYRESISKEHGYVIDDDLLSDEQLFGLSLLPLHIAANAQAYAKRVAHIMRSEHGPQIEEIISEQASKNEPPADYFDYLMQRLNA